MKSFEMVFVINPKHGTLYHIIKWINEEYRGDELQSFAEQKLNLPDQKRINSKVAMGFSRKEIQEIFYRKKI